MELSETIKSIRTSKVGMYADRLTEGMAIHLIMTRIITEMTELALAGVASRAFSMSRCIRHYVEFEAERMETDFKDVCYAVSMRLYEDHDLYVKQVSNDVLIVSTEHIPDNVRPDFEEVKTDYLDEEANAYTVDAWEIGKEEGRVIATVNKTTGDVYWIDKQAKEYSDKAKEAVYRLVEQIRKGQ